VFEGSEDFAMTCGWFYYDLRLISLWFTVDINYRWYMNYPP